MGASGALNPEKRALILAAGPVTDLSLLQKRIEPYDLLLCADGGADLAAALKLSPDLVLGDMDSIEEMRPETETVRFPREKDDTDLALAVQEALLRGCGRIDILGAFGGRADHFWGNVQTVYRAFLAGAKVRLLSEDTELFFVRNTAIQLENRGEKYVSVFSFTPYCKGVSLKGLKYPLDHAELTFDRPLGVSNEFAADQAVIEVEEGTLLIMLIKADGGK